MKRLHPHWGRREKKQHTKKKKQREETNQHDWKDVCFLREKVRGCDAVWPFSAPVRHAVCDKATRGRTDWCRIVVSLICLPTVSDKNFSVPLLIKRKRNTYNQIVLNMFLYQVFTSLFLFLKPTVQQVWWQAYKVMVRKCSFIIGLIISIKRYSKKIMSKLNTWSCNTNIFFQNLKKENKRNEKVYLTFKSGFVQL